MTCDCDWFVLATCNLTLRCGICKPQEIHFFVWLIQIRIDNNTSASEKNISNSITGLQGSLSDIEYSNTRTYRTAIADAYFEHSAIGPKTAAPY